MSDLDPKLYTKYPDSFTSDQEFDLDKRVQVVNEVPPVDLLALLVTPLKTNPLWQWLVGRSAVTYDVEWNEKTGNHEEFDFNGYLEEPAVAKYINGVRSKDYGPTPETINGETTYPTGTRIAIEGVLLPEFDLMLHEAYRYLDKLYPDHPTYTKLLTNNELNDSFESMGDFLDYDIDCKFYDFVAKGLPYDNLFGSDLAAAKDREAFKMKYRNLVNNAFRRKLYGSLAGYRAYAGDVFRKVQVYPLGKYFPFLPYENDDPTIPNESPSKNTKWLVQYQDKPSDYDERRVNRLNKKYLDEFRMLDVEAKSYDYSSYEPPDYKVKVYSTAKTPYKVYEFTYCNGFNHPSDLENFFMDGMKLVMLNGATAYVSRVDKDARKKQRLVIDARNVDDKLYNYETIRLLGDAHYAVVTTEVEPVYTKAFVYPSAKELVDYAGANGVDLTTTLYDATAADPATDFDKAYRTLFDAILKKSNRLPIPQKEVRIMTSPWADGSLLIPYDVEQSMYADGLTAEFPFDGSGVKSAKFVGDEFGEKWPYRFGSKVSIGLEWPKTTKATIAAVVGCKKGSFKLKFSFEPIYELDYPTLRDSLNTDKPTIGVLLSTQRGLVAATGFFDAVFEGPNLRNEYALVSATFRISSIPIVKDVDLLRYIYSDERMGEHSFDSYVEAKRIVLDELFEDRTTLPTDNLFRKMSVLLKATNDARNKINEKLAPITNGVERGAFASDSDSKLSDLITPLNSASDKLGESLWTPHVDDFNRKNFIKSATNAFVANKKVKDKTVYYDELKKYVDALDAAVKKCYSDAMGRVAVDPNREYYAGVDGPAKQTLANIDRAIDAMRANRFMLLNPAPSIVDLVNPDFESKTNCFIDVTQGSQRIEQVFEARIDPMFQDSISYYDVDRIGKGIVDEIVQGEVNCIDLEINGELSPPPPHNAIFVDGIDDWKTIEKTLHNYIYKINNGEKLEPRTTNVIDLTKDLFEANEKVDHWHQKATYFPIELVESFEVTGVENNGTNMTGHQMSRHSTQILTTINLDKDDFTLFFEADAAKEAMKNVSVGDLVSGTSVEKDAYITEVDMDAKTAKVSKPLRKSGSFLLYYDLRLKSLPVENYEDFYRYKFDLQKDKILDLSSPFEHGLYPSAAWPRTSEAAILPTPDPRLYKERLVEDLKSDKKYVNYFRKICAALYFEGTKKADHYVLPSLFDVPGDLYLELPLDRIVDDKLMDVATMDYFSGAKETIARAGDALGVGVNLTVQTDLSGNYSPISGARWTDPSIKMLARTLNWNDKTIPSYIELGSGDLSKDNARYFRFWKKNFNQAYKERPFEEKSFWNYDSWEDVSNPKVYEALKRLKEEDVDDEGNKKSDQDDRHIITDVEGIDRTVWFAKNFLYDGDEDPKMKIDHVSKPLFEVALGEHELEGKKSFEGDPNSTYTFINASIARQQYDGVSQDNPTDLIAVSESFLDNEILLTPPKSTFEVKVDESTIVLTIDRYCEALIHDGDWSPTKKSDGLIDWPKAPPIDGRSHYVTIPVTTVVKNAKSREDEYSEDKTFNSGQVLFYEKQPSGEWEWVVRSFRFSGLLGSGAVILKKLTLKDDFVEQPELTLRACLAPGPQPQDTLNQENGDLTMLHRMLTRLLEQTKVFKNDTTKLRKFTVLEQTELARWIEAEITDETVAEWTTNNYKEEFASVSEMINKKLKLDEDKREILPTSFVAEDGFKINLNNFYWFQYLAGDETWEKPMSAAGFKPGSAFAIKYDHDKNRFKFFLINTDCKFFYMLDTSHSKGMDAAEWATFIGDFGSTGEALLPVESVKANQNLIDLPKSRLLKGTTSVSFRIDPRFTAKGHRLSDFIKNKNSAEPVDVVVSESPIRADDDLKALITSNFDRETGESIEYVVKQDDNRYWKNTMFLAAKYAVETVENGNVVKDVPILRPIDGVSFDVDEASTMDRVLKIEEIGVRSEYSTTLEPKFFSSYEEVTGVLHGVRYSDVEKALQIGYRFEKGAIQAAKRAEFVAEVDKIWPVRKVDGTDIKYPNKKIEFPTALGDAIESPEIVKVVAYGEKQEEDKGFKYFRNALVLEGTIDPAKPGRIDFTNNPRAKSALLHLAPNDPVIDIVPLSSSEVGAVDVVSIGHASSVVDWNDGSLIAVDKTGGVFIAKRSTASAIASGADAFMKFTAPRAEDAALSLNSLAYDKDDKKWILAYSIKRSDGTTIESVEYSFDASTGEFEDISSIPGQDIDTQQIVDLRDVSSGSLGLSPNDVVQKVLARDVAMVSVASDPETKEVVAPSEGDQWSFEEGPFNPYRTAASPSLDMFAAYDKSGYQARVFGEYIFLKSPTATRDEDTLEKVDKTVNMHWKLSKLPTRRSIEAAELWSMGVAAAGEFVDSYAKAVVSMIDALMTSPLDDPNSATIYQNLRTWISSHPPKQYSDENSLPEAIIINNISYEQNGTEKIPVFGVASKEYRSKTVNGVLLKTQNYYDYLYDYLKYILGVAKYEDYASNGIDDLFFTSRGLVAVTKYGDYLSLPYGFMESRSDIEDDMNWATSSVDPTYVFHGDEATNVPRRLKMSVNGEEKVFEIKSWPIPKPIKAFSIESTFVVDGSVVLCGYVKAPQAMLSSSSPFVEFGRGIASQFPNDGSRILPNAYPFVAVSNDGCKTFEVIDFDVDGRIPKVDKFPASNSTNYKAYSASRVGDEVRVWMCSVSPNTDPSDKTKTLPYSPKGFIKLAVRTTGGATELRYVPGFEKIEPSSKTMLLNEGYDEASLDYIKGKTDNYYRPWEYDALMLAKATKFAKVDAVGIAVVNDDLLLVQGPYSPKLTPAATVTRISDATVFFTGSTATPLKSDKIAVLASFDPVKSVPNQGEFLSFASRYVGNDGRLLAKDTIEVDDILQANRLYSRREAMRPIDREDSKEGFPAISEDEDKKFYAYEPSYDSNVVDETGKVEVVKIYDYAKAKNFYGDEVVLCDESGDYLMQKDSNMVNNSLSTIALVRLGVSPSMLAKAGVAKDGVNANEVDGELSNLLSGSLVSKASIDPSNPAMIITPPNVDELLKYLAKNGYLYEFTTDGDKPIETKDDEVTDLGLAVKWIEDNVGGWGTFDNPFSKYDDGSMLGPFRLTHVEFSNIDGSFVYDSVLGVALLKKPITASSLMRIGYKYSAGTYEYARSLFSFDEGNALATAVQSHPVTDVYMPPRGYGGDEVNDSFDVDHPWELDPLAFKNLLTVNTVGDYVYMCEPDGSLLKVKRGYFWLDEGEAVTVTHDNLAKEGLNVVKLTDDVDLKPDALNFYKLPPPKLELYSAKDEVYFTADDETKARNVMLCYVVRNGRKDEASDYRVEFFDIEGTEIKGLTLIDDDYGWIKFDPEKNGESLPIISGDRFEIVVTDEEWGVVAKKWFSVAKSKDELNNKVFEKYKVSRVSNVEVYSAKGRDDGYPKKSIGSIEFKCDERIDTNDLNDLNDANIVILNQRIQTPVSKPSFIAPGSSFEVPFSLLDEFSGEVKLQIQKKSMVFNVNLPIHFVDEIEILTDRDWYIDDADETRVKDRAEVYSRDLNLTKEFSEDSNLDDGFTKSKGSLVIFKELKQKTRELDDFKGLDFDELGDYKFIFDKSEKDEFAVYSRFLVDGLYGRLLLKKPSYSSFYNLIEELKRDISYEKEKVLYEYDGTADKFSIVDIAADFSNAKLNIKIDGSPKFVKLRLLPAGTVAPPVKVLNDENYFIEVSGSDLDRFGFDRIMFNSDSYPTMPIWVGSTFFNQGNIKYFHDRDYLNRDGFKVFLANEKGKFVRFIVHEGQPFEKELGKDGDLSVDVTGSYDRRYVPREPVFKSAYEWFKNNFYIEGYEANPFWQSINIVEKLNRASFEVTQLTKITKLKKIGNSMVEVEVPSKEGYCTIHQAVGYSVADLQTLIESNLPFIDYEAGRVNFIASSPGEKYRNAEYLTEYGIKFKNSFCLTSGAYRDVWFSKAELKNRLKYSYIVNSTENAFDEGDKDASIVEVTEMGVFDQNHHLILYSTFPSVEYRSDEHHFSVALFIRNMALAAVKTNQLAIGR